jgi:lysophospholipase L1-like esterase
MATVLPAVAALLAAAALAPARPAAALTIVAIGDSITAGTTRSGSPGGGPGAALRDPEGGYPARLARELGGAAVVVNRGAGGATTRFWLDAPGAEPAVLERFAAALWPDLRPRVAAAPGQSLLAWVLANERPDVVLLLIGANDLKEEAAPDPAAIAARVARMAQEARAADARVLVGTLLPNRRDPQAALDEMNRRLCEAEPDCVRIDERFRAAGGTELLGDEIHPSARGHAAIASAFGAALRQRGLVPGGDAQPGAGLSFPSPTAAPPARGGAAP